MENAVATYLRALLAGYPAPNEICSRATLPPSIDGYRSRTGLQLNAAQRKAVEMAVHYPLSVLTGGAGTGKTTVLQVIHDIPEQIGVPVLEVAISRRAARRMRAAT